MSLTITTILLTNCDAAYCVSFSLTFYQLRFWLHSSEMIQIRIYGMLEDHSDQGASKVLMNLWDLAVPLMHKMMQMILDH